MYSLGPYTCPTLWRWLHLRTAQPECFWSWWMVILTHGEVMPGRSWHLQVILGWCDVSRWAARWWTPGCSPFLLLSWHFLFTDIWKCAKQGRRGLISALFSNSSALREEMAADETPGWRALKPVSRCEKNNVLPVCFNGNVHRRTFEQLFQPINKHVFICRVGGGGGVCTQQISAVRGR